MNALELADQTAEPVQVLGMSYYFDPVTTERAGQLGLNVFQYYGLGRGGVLGGVDTYRVGQAFTFFHPRTIDLIYAKARELADPVATAAEHLQSAYSFADRTFGGVDETLLAAIADATEKVLAVVPTGRYALVDGYRAFEVPALARHAAYRAIILQRELRGGVHIDAVRDAGLTPSEACFAQGEVIFKLHGYGDEDVPVDQSDLAAKKADAEVRTSAGVAQYYEVLSERERDDVASGVAQMHAALANPVAAG